jgi:cysteine dioxygenase
MSPVFQLLSHQQEGYDRKISVESVKGENVSYISHQYPPSPALSDPDSLASSVPDIAFSGSLSINLFDELVEDIRAILGPSSGLDSADVDVDHLMETMGRYDALEHENEWQKYALSDPSRSYTRNGVDDINKKANLLILVWNPGRGSMIHDHANAHCIVKLLKGTLVETLFDWPTHEDEQLKPTRVTAISPGKVTYMADQLGLHRMHNPSSSEVAVSLHLYTPPYAAEFGCHIFDEDSGKSHKVDLSTLYSNKGVRCAPQGCRC